MSMTTSERELLLSLAKVIVDGAGIEERVKIERLRTIVEREPFIPEIRAREAHEAGRVDRVAEVLAARLPYANEGNMADLARVVCALAAVPPAPASKETTMNDAQISHMLDRFLAWRLPNDFRPDNGISYARPNYAPNVDATPTGTNLFDAAQALAMIRHMVEGMPAPTPEAK